MFEKLNEKLKEEETQRAILHGVGLVATFVATQVFAHLTHKGVELGIDKLMEKIHGTTVTPAE